MDKIKVIVKYLTSFFKSKWSIDDYPLRYRQQAVDYKKAPLWIVQVINWSGMNGTGETRAEAYHDLSQGLEERRNRGKNLPRPGKRVPLEFAPTVRIEMYADIAERFLREVMEFSLERPVFISDDSKLSDFSFLGMEDEYIERIHKVFNVDVSDIESGTLADIFERIHKAS